MEEIERQENSLNVGPKQKKQQTLKASLICQILRAQGLGGVERQVAGVGPRNSRTHFGETKDHITKNSRNQKGYTLRKMLGEAYSKEKRTYNLEEDTYYTCN